MPSLITSRLKFVRNKTCSELFTARWVVTLVISACGYVSSVVILRFLRMNFMLFLNNGWRRKTCLESRNKAENEKISVLQNLHA